MSNLFKTAQYVETQSHKTDSQIKWLINTQWSHKWLNYTNKAGMLSFNTMLLMTYLLNSNSRAFPFVSLHKRKKLRIAQTWKSFHGKHTI